MIKYLLILLTPLYLMSQSDYTCKIHEVSNSFYKPLINESFNLERKTGVMSGALRNDYVTKPNIIDMGGKDNSYKVVTTLTTNQGYGKGSNVHVLIVDEYVKTDSKPFVYLWNSDIFTGICEY